MQDAVEEASTRRRSRGVESSQNRRISMTVLRPAAATAEQTANQVLSLLPQRCAVLHARRALHPGFAAHGDVAAERDVAFDG